MLQQQWGCLLLSTHRMLTVYPKLNYSIKLRKTTGIKFKTQNDFHCPSKHKSLCVHMLVSKDPKPPRDFFSRKPKFLPTKTDYTIETPNEHLTVDKHFRLYQLGPIGGLKYKLFN